MSVAAITFLLAGSSSSVMFASLDCSGSQTPGACPGRVDAEVANSIVLQVPSFTARSASLLISRPLTTPTCHMWRAPCRWAPRCRLLKRFEASHDHLHSVQCLTLCVDN